MKVAALDIGGTAIKYAVWNGSSLLKAKFLDTPCNNAIFLLSSVVKIVRSLGPVDAVGISTRGQVNDQGVILFDNGPIPDYTGTPVKAYLEKALQIPVFVENDVNAAAYGEAKCGAGRNVKDFLCITYGTGIGGAILQNGKLMRGSNFSAGEFGAMQLFSQSPDGDGLCAAFYENLASASALVKDAKAVCPEIKNGIDVCARMNEAPLKPVISSWVKNVSYGLSSLIHIFNPSLIVVGGGIMQNRDLFEQIKQCTMAQIMPGFETVSLVHAELGNSAGLVGAAFLAQEML